MLDINSDEKRINDRLDELEIIIDKLLEEPPEDLTKLESYVFEHRRLVDMLMKLKRQKCLI